MFYQKYQIAKLLEYNSSRFQNTQCCKIRLFESHYAGIQKHEKVCIFTLPRRYLHPKNIICSFCFAFSHRRNMNKNLWLFVVFAVTIQSGQSALFLPGQTFYLPFPTTYKIERGSYDLTFQCSKILVANGQVTKKDCVLKGIRIKNQGATRPRTATPRTAIASLFAVKNVLFEQTRGLQKLMNN